MARNTHTGGVPAWLPRAAVLGASLNGGLMTPQVRLQWEVTLVQAHHDAFLLGFEGGGGYAAAFPNKGFGPTASDSMTYMYQHTLLAGIAYRAVYENGFAWGFHVFTGPLWYGARIQNAATENFFTGWVEGGVQVGLQSGPIIYGLAFRYGNLYDPPRRSQAGPYVGGPFLGFYADWRP